MYTYLSNTIRVPIKNKTVQEIIPIYFCISVGLGKDIPYDYIVEVRNRLKGLDLIDRVPDELWNEVHDIVQEQGSRPSPWKRNTKKENGCLGKPYKSCEKKRSGKQRRKGKI